MLSNSTLRIKNLESGLKTPYIPMAKARGITAQFGNFGANASKLFTSPELAVTHFAKHGRRVQNALGKNSYSFGEYMNDANHVINTGLHIPERSAYVKIIGGVGEAKVAFVGIERNIGTITTFHIKTVNEVSKMAPSLGWMK